MQSVLAVSILLLATGLLLLGCGKGGRSGDQDKARKPKKSRSEAPDTEMEEVLHGPFADADRQAASESPAREPGRVPAFSEAERKVIRSYSQALKEMHAKQIELLHASQRKLDAAKRRDSLVARREADAVDEIWLALNQAADRVTLYGAKLNVLVAGDHNRNVRVTQRVKDIAGIHPSESPAIIKRLSARAQENLKEAQRLLR